MENTIEIERLGRILKSKARILISHAIVESSKTDDLVYHDKLHDISLKIYEALTSDDLQQLIDLTNELDLLIKPKRHYGTFIKGIKST
jgi:hypothetical protein